MLRVAAWALAICAHTVSLAGPYINSELKQGRMLLKPSIQLRV